MSCSIGLCHAYDVLMRLNGSCETVENDKIGLSWIDWTPLKVNDNVNELYIVITNRSI